MIYKLFKKKSYSHREYLWIEASTMDELFEKYLEAVRCYGNDRFKEWRERITKEFKKAQDDFFVTGYGSLCHRLQVIDPELKKKYMADGGAVCPYCDSNDLETVSPIEWSSASTAIETQKCGNCDREWVDHYTLTDVEFIN